MGRSSWSLGSLPVAGARVQRNTSQAGFFPRIERLLLRSGSQGSLLKGGLSIICWFFWWSKTNVGLLWLCNAEQLHPLRSSLHKLFAQKGTSPFGRAFFILSFGWTELVGGSLPVACRGSDSPSPLPHPSPRPRALGKGLVISGSWSEMAPSAETLEPERSVTGYTKMGGCPFAALQSKPTK